MYEQRKQLERAKTGDILKAKIQQRPDRRELERRHILEHDECHVDPSLAERQRMLKKARLADQLNSQLSHRPGPLELIKKNILHTEEPIERIVKEGLITFKATSEGLLNRPQQPNGYVSYEEDSQSSDGDQRNSPSGAESQEVAPSSQSEPISEIDVAAATPPSTVAAIPVACASIAPVVTFAAPTLASTSDTFQVKPETSTLFAELCQSVVDTSAVAPLKFSPSLPKASSTPSLSGLTSRPSPQPLSARLPSAKSDSLGKDKSRKKNKLKPINKTRTIKFHEYKGPPNAQKNGLTSLSSEETSYQLLLKQQTCLLEYLEGLNKNPANASNCKSSETSSFSLSQNPIPSPVLPSASTVPASPLSNMSDSIGLELSKLEKMKVSDLKMLLKTRNLPVSGPKPQLIERLRPFLQSDCSDAMSTDLTSDSPQQSVIQSDSDNVEMAELQQPRSANPMSNDELLREQQRKIDELQRRLEQSQQELQQMQQRKEQHHQPIPESSAKAAPAPKTDVPNQKQIFKQQLEAKIQKEKMQKIENKQKQLLEQQQQQQKQQLQQAQFAFQKKCSGE